MLDMHMSITVSLRAQDVPDYQFIDRLRSLLNPKCHRSKSQLRTHFHVQTEQFWV